MSYVPPKKNAPYTVYTALTDQTNVLLFKSNPTLAVGDCLVSVDGGPFANLTILPDPEPNGGSAVRIQLSSSEMNGDNSVILLHDVAGNEWCDQLINLQTTPYQFGDLPAAIVQYLLTHISGLIGFFKNLHSDLGCLYRGDTWTYTIGNLGDLSTATNIWLAIKKKSKDADSAALLLVSLGTGLEVINQAPASVPLDGSLGIVLPATSGFIDWYTHQDETAKLEPGKYYYDIQVETPYGLGSRIDTKRAGTVTIEGDIVRTTT